MPVYTKREYSIVTGFFAQDDPDADAVAIGALPPRFGLLDDSADRWDRFKARIKELNAAAAPGTQYKVYFFARHGQGFHNVGEAKYGTKAWDEYWSKLDSDGELVWGPDPELTSVGLGQARAAREAWRTERASGIPLPERHYASPLQRALRTFQETFVGADFLDGPPIRCTILENLREESGEHTCDKRSPRGVIAQKFPPPIYDFEEGFSEEDTFWKPDVRETKAHVTERAVQVFDRIFSLDKETYLCISAHSGIINGFLRAMGRPGYPLVTGGVLPLVIKAVDVQLTQSWAPSVPELW
ncbi:phosphoglycerate mutase-like protein [Lentinus brumalis]|uniref:Phosphoglycerate mutase-like protein n=1 Tax=Lentinus brumalis TaxID=2498619 RepID=A0A371DK13_9APHY|nr:phosphoglycerate mutase-like protein [Polyporus brumalis]